MRIKIFVYIASMLMTSIALAVGDGSDDSTQTGNLFVEKGPSEIKNLGKILESLKSVIPSEKYQCAVTEILKSVNPSAYSGDNGVGGSNAGLNKFFNDFAESNSCFAGEASKFWARMSTELAMPKKNPENDSSLSGAFSFMTLAGSGRPTLGERAGEGRFSNFSPGFLWRSALSVTKGDTSAAVLLIGMCTHDDFSMSIRVPSDPQQMREDLKQRIEKQTKQINDFRQELVNISKDSDEFKFISIQIENWSKKVLKMNDDLANNRIPKFSTQICPERNSAATLPGSIGENVDIPQALKREIAAIQKPNGSTNDLPAKAYHFTGGIMVGCQMGKCGLSPIEAETVAGLIANGYRAIRICSNVKSLLNQQETLLQESGAYRIDAPDFPEKAKNYLARSYAETKLRFTGMAGGMAVMPNAPGNEIGFLENSTPQHGATAEVKTAIMESAIKEATAKLIELDSARLFNRWYLGTTGICTTVRTGGPADLMATDQTQRPDPNTGVRRGGTVCDIPGWSLERCEKARKKLATWDEDFKWTAAQHRIGARFGAEQCKPDRKPAGDFDKKFCSDSAASSPGGRSIQRPASQ